MNLWKNILGLSWKFCVFVLGLYGLLKLIKETRLIALNIPDWFFFIWSVFFSLVLLITVDFVNKSRGAAADDSGLKKEIEGLKQSLDASKKEVNRFENEFREIINKQGETIARMYNDPKQFVNLEPNEEILLVLEILANQRSNSYDCRGMELAYKKKFEKKSMADYNIAINTLDSYGYIRIDDNDDDFPEYRITAVGLAYFARAREK